jgi:hypothetical protein|tara:strand:- start:2618 stop:3145 length:528 start_codon:yes stop_codon:yes gene_type:complete
LSTQSLNKTLLEVIDKPEIWSENHDLIDSLKSQSKLAKWVSLERNITGCSLNTLKSSADKILNDGFSGIDLRRIGALEAIEQEVAKKLRPKPGTRIALEAKAKEQAVKISALEARNMTLTFFIRELQSIAENAILSSASKESAVRHKRNLDVVHAKLSACGEDSLVVIAELFNEE